eukprot:4336985-Prymnesium_polylepis.2
MTATSMRATTPACSANATSSFSARSRSSLSFIVSEYGFAASAFICSLAAASRASTSKRIVSAFISGTVAICACEASRFSVPSRSTSWRSTVGAASGRRR